MFLGSPSQAITDWIKKHYQQQFTITGSVDKGGEPDAELSGIGTYLSGQIANVSIANLHQTY